MSPKKKPDELDETSAVGDREFLARRHRILRAQAGRLAEEEEAREIIRERKARGKNPALPIRRR